MLKLTVIFASIISVALSLSVYRDDSSSTYDDVSLPVVCKHGKCRVAGDVAAVTSNNRYYPNYISTGQGRSSNEVTSQWFTLNSFLESLEGNSAGRQMTGSSGGLQSQATYCGISSEHTVCRFSGVGPSCTDKSPRVVTAGDIPQIVDLHNDFRRRVASGLTNQPAAADMVAVVWDDEVAGIAQRWADQCTFEHDTNRNTVADGYNGQNIYISFGSGGEPDWQAAVTAWFDEINNFPPSGVSSFGSAMEGGQTGHYTQLVWSRTTRIGCGYSEYSNAQGRNKFYVCNYAPGGNIAGQPLYQTGPACSACPAAHPTCTNSLCS